MVMDWILRAILAGVLFLLGWVVFHLVNTHLLKNIGGKAMRLDEFRPGVAAIVYFTTPDCVACKMAQRPALEKLKQMLGDQLQIIEINAYEKPDLTKEWGVLSVPTTFILDIKGNPRHVNHGVTSAEKLLDQLHQG